jgi:hypothetical protein
MNLWLAVGAAGLCAAAGGVMLRARRSAGPRRAMPSGPPAPGMPVLVIDHTTAHVAAAPGRAAELHAWLRARGAECALRPGWGPGGLDVIDFGNPGPAEERSIRDLFAEWRRYGGGDSSTS